MKKRIYIFNIILATIIYLVLYWKSIFGGMTLFYKDVGVDTINIIYSVHNFILTHYKDWFEYSFQLGLGACVYTRCSGLFNPILYIMVIMGEGNQVDYYLVGSYMCIIMSSLIGAQICYKYSLKGWIAIIGGIMWAYSGWIMLWGQQLPFMIAYSFFSLYFGALLSFDSSKWTRWLGLILSLIALSTSGYYWLYMAGVFGCIYFLEKGILYRESGICILKNELKLLLCGIISILVSAVKLFPELQMFLNSSRAGNLSSIGSMGEIYSVEYLITDIARLFSNNSLGFADAYSGSYNYYEGTILWATQLGVFGIIFWLLQKKNSKIDIRKFCVFIFNIILLLIPVATHFFTFDERKQRWTFVLIMLQILLISNMLSKIKSVGEEIVLKTVAYSLLVYLLLLFILLLGNHLGIITIQGIVVKISVIFIVLYALMLVSSRRLNGKLIIGVWIILVSCNLITENYATYNNRQNISKTDFENSYYNDGTDKAIEYIKSIDNGLYRIQKDYISVSFNDSMVQGYNGVAEYNEVEPNSVAQFMYLNSIPFAIDADYSKASKYINLPEKNYNISTLLGVKYLLSRQDKEIDNYTKIKQVGDVYIYQNENSLLFGYLYENELNLELYNKLSQEQKDVALTAGFYYTEKSNGSQEHKFNQADFNKNNISILRNGIYSVSYANNLYQAKVSNLYESDSMLCVPIFFDKDWEAYVDGSKIDIQSINGGLVGVIIEPGEHDVVLKYSNKIVFIGISVSIIGLVFLVILLYYIKSRRERLRENERKNVEIC